MRALLSESIILETGFIAAFRLEIPRWSGTGRVRTSNTFLLLWEFSNNFFLNRCYLKAVCTEPGDRSAFFLDPIPAVFSLKINHLH